MKKFKFPVPYPLVVKSKRCLDNHSHYNLFGNPEIRAKKPAGICERGKEMCRVYHVSRGNRHQLLRDRSMLDLLATTSFWACQPSEVNSAHFIGPPSKALQSFISVFLLLNRESVSAKTAEGSLIVTPGFGFPEKSGTMLIRMLGGLMSLMLSSF